VVDDDDHVIDTVTRAEMRARRLQHRGVSIAVVSTAGQLLVHRRAATKDIWPSMWDLAAGGVVAAGETYDDAARRELDEELGIAVEADALEVVGSGRYVDDSVALLGRGYVTVHDGPFRFTDGEVDEARWVSRAELDALLVVESFVPDSLTLMLPLVLPLLAG